MTHINFYTLLQLNDATFPIGSYTLSWGLETFVQQGVIFDSESAEAFLSGELESNFLTNELLPVRLSYEAFKQGAFEGLLRIDEIYNASKSAKEIREGSRKIAARFLKTAGSWHGEEKVSGPCDSSSDRYDFLKKLNHFPVVYGAFCALEEIEEDLVLQGFLYSQISARVTNAVKLVPLSQTDGQKILHSLFEKFTVLLEEVWQLEEEDLCRAAPGSEIRGMQHEYLYTRLYMS